jgi:hypothetical protein
MLTIVYLATLGAWTICIMTIGGLFFRNRVVSVLGLVLTWFGIWFGVATVFVAKVGVGFPESCLVASRGSSALYKIIFRRRDNRRCRRYVLWLPYAHARFYGIFSRRLDDRRRGARRQWTIVVSCGFPRLRFAINGTLCRHDDRRRDAHRRLHNIVSYGSSRLICYKCNLVSASRCSTYVCQRRVLWHS